MEIARSSLFEADEIVVGKPWEEKLDLLQTELS
jgi:hypothetical protein